MKHVAETDGAEQSGAHGVEGVGDGIEAREELEPIGKDGYGEKHSARDAGNSEKKPLGRVAAFEEEKVTGGKDAETGEGQKRNQKNQNDSGPICGIEGEAKKERAPSDVNGNAKGCGGERIKSRAGENCRQGRLRDEKMFERAGVARFLEAAVEGIEGGV